ncbi:MAG: NADH:flavin oxidoreductase [Spirochaetes bacterium]|nr:NADH:flavin oxidoreductase [Spirochaetota bacterium]
MADDILFTSFKIGSLTVPNRIARSATMDYRAADDGSVTDVQVALYDSLAKGGCGLIITGFLYVSPDGRSASRQTGIDNDALIPGLHRLTDTVHAAGMTIAAQLVHGGVQIRKKTPGDLMAPSVLPSYTGVREMNDADIKLLIDSFIQAAVRAKTAGFDAVELHAAHGYLLSSFLSPVTNLRTDIYGGSTENRARIVIDIIRGIKSACGIPVMIKMNGDDGYDGRGIDADEAARIAVLLEAAGADALEISRGMIGSVRTPAEPNIETAGEGYNLAAAARIKKAVSIPVIAVGGIRDKQSAVDALSNGTCDFIAFSRPLVREPDLPNKFRAGAERAECISCNRCFNPRGLACGQVGKG